MSDNAVTPEPDPGRRRGSEARRPPYRSTPERPLRYTSTGGGIYHDRRTAAVTPPDPEGIPFSRNQGYLARPRTPHYQAGLASW